MAGGSLRILSRSRESFADRSEAGLLLGDALAGGEEPGALVLGIPRGGVIVAAAARPALGADLNVVLSRKIGAPFNPELALGAVSEGGEVFLLEDLLRRVKVEGEYLELEKGRQLREIAARAERYRALLPVDSCRGRTVVVTDDGVATGATLQAALWTVRRESPARLVAALPVAPEETLRRLTADADEILCLRAPSPFAAVGQFYRDFRQTEEEEVLALLEAEAARRRG